VSIVSSTIPTPTIEQLRAARVAFEANEPRNLFYRAATELIDLAFRGATKLTVAEALAVLLQTWNAMFYRYRGGFTADHFGDIECLLVDHRDALSLFRARSIEQYRAEDQPKVEQIFNAFEVVLGPVGSAKCLHLLAPQFFPIWDRRIAQSYRAALKVGGGNGSQYTKFMSLTQRQVSEIGGQQAIGRNPLKALDEYNYCRYTKRWPLTTTTESPVLDQGLTNASSGFGGQSLAGSS